MSADPAGNITRMVNRLEKLPSYLEADQANLANTQQQLDQAKALQFEPFPQEQELTEKLTRLAELTQALNLDNKKKQAQQEEQPEEKSESVADRPKRLSDRLREARAAIAASQPMSQGNAVRRMAVEH